MSVIPVLLASEGSAFSAVAVPPASNTSTATSSKTIGTITAVPSDGVGPYTYAWAKTVDPFNATATITSPSAAGTTISVTGIASGDRVVGEITCTVTDTSSGATAEAVATFDVQHTGIPA